MGSRTVQSAILGALAAIAAARGATAIAANHYVTSTRGARVIDLTGTPALGMGIAYVAMGAALTAVALYQYGRYRRSILVAGGLSVAVAVAGFAVGILA